jgi:hypothetical protein
MHASILCPQKSILNATGSTLDLSSNICFADSMALFRFTSLIAAADCFDLLLFSVVNTTLQRCSLRRGEDVCEREAEASSRTKRVLRAGQGREANSTASFCTHGNQNRGMTDMPEFRK